MSGLPTSPTGPPGSSVTAATRDEKITLSDDAFTESAEALIHRDFFPDLPKLKAHLMLLDVVDGGTAQQAAALDAVKALAQEEHRKASMVEGMNLDEFLGKYTNEDAVSFAQLQEKHRRLHRKKYGWVFAPDEAFKKRLLLSGGEQALLEYQKEEERKRVELQELRTLMLPPPPRGPSEEGGSSSTSAYQAAHPRQINHSGTHLSAMVTVAKDKDLSSFAARPLEKTVWEEITSDLSLIAQKKLEKEQNMYDLDDYNATPRSRASGVMPSPRVNGYGFARTPQFSPSGQDGCSPLLTWGDVATPTVLAVDPVDYISGPTFSIGSTPSRERVGHVLADQAAQRMRSEKRCRPLTSVRASVRTPSAGPARPTSRPRT
eukprot:RCo052551